MKKYKKIKNKSPLNQDIDEIQYIEDISNLQKKDKSKNEYIYYLNPKNDKTNIKTKINTYNQDNIEETLKIKNKSIDLKIAHKQKEIDINKSSSKKPKKKLIKRKKKIKKIEIASINETERNNPKNTLKKTEIPTPTPNGNDEDMNSFYLIDYQSKNKDIENKEEETPKASDDNYQTFYQNDLTKNFSEVNNLTSNLTEKYKKFNFSISSANTSNGFSKKYHNNISQKKEEISPERLSFEETENSNKKEDRPNKMRIIKFRDKSETNKIKMDFPTDKIKEENKDNHIIYKKIEMKSPMSHKEIIKKKKKLLYRKKLNLQNNKIIFIQSVWRRYKIIKLVNLYKNIIKFNTIMNKIINKKLKKYLLLLLEQINLFYGKNQRSIIIKKIKKRKLRIKNNSPKSSKDDNPDNEIQDNPINNINKEDNNNNYFKTNIKLQDRKLFFSSPNNNIRRRNIQLCKSPIYNNKTSGNNDDYCLLQDSCVNNTFTGNDTITNNNLFNYDTNKIEQNKLSLKISKIKPKFKKHKLENINNNSFDSKLLSPDKRNTKSEIKPPILHKIYIKSIENFSPLKPLNFRIIKKNKNCFFNKFDEESLIKCNNDKISFINKNEKNKNINYYKKIIGENPFSKNKSKKNKNDFSLIKFILKTKDVVSNNIKKKYFYTLVNYILKKCFLSKMINIYYKKKISLMKNALNNFRIKIQVLKYIEQYNNIEKINRKNNMRISNNETINIANEICNNINGEKYIENNELFIPSKNYGKKIKAKNKNISINKFDKKKLEIYKNIYNMEIKSKYKIKNELIIHKIMSKLNINNNKEIKFKDQKLLISKNVSNIKISKEKNENFIIHKITNGFTILKDYNKVTKFNNNKLIYNKIISKKIINSKNKNIFIIDKVAEFKIKDNNKKNNFIINKLINKSPIIYTKKKNLNRNLVISKTINNLKYKGITKNNNNLIINKVNSNYIIDDKNKYNENMKIKYYNSMIKNNKNNLFINKTVSIFNIKPKKKIFYITKNSKIFIKSDKNVNNYIITKEININISGDNLIRKSLYQFNENKLIMTKVKNYLIKNKGIDKIKKQIIYPISLFKIKSVLLKNIHKYVYSKIINIMTKYSFCNHISKFNNKNIFILKVSFINSLKNKKLEQKFKKLYIKNKFTSLIINKVINYKILKNNSIEKPKHYIINKVKLFTLLNNEIKNDNDHLNYELYKNRNKNFITGNVITKKINLFISNNDKKLNNHENKSNLINENEQISKNSQNYFNKNTDNKIYISRLKMNNSKNMNIINHYYPSYNSPLIYNNKIYYKTKSKENENHMIQKIKNKLNEIQSEDKQIINKGEESPQKEIIIDEQREKNYKYIRMKPEEISDEEEEEEEIEEEEEESEFLEDAKEILKKYIQKKINILNKRFINSFHKWKRNKNYNVIKFRNRINKKSVNEDICENGGINKSKRIFIIYRKYRDYSYIMKKKFLSRWKKLVEDEYNEEDKKEESNKDQIGFIEEEEEYEEEIEEEIE